MTTPANSDENRRIPVALVLSVLTSWFALTALGSNHSGAGMTGTEFVLLLALFPLEFLAFSLLIYGIIRAFTSKLEKSYFIAVAVFASPLPAITIGEFVKTNLNSNKAAKREALSPK